MPEQSKIKKVDISFTNWMLGGSLISVRDGDQGRHRASSRKVAVLEVTVGFNYTYHHTSLLQPSDAIMVFNTQCLFLT